MKFRPVLENRWFNKEKTYRQVNWESFPDIVYEFHARIYTWYIEPIKALHKASGHYGFAAMALNCLLVDTLSQYYFGKPQSTKTDFKKFVRIMLPEFTTQLPQPIVVSNQVTLYDVADVLYHGYRCGILHEAHIPLYGMIGGAGGEIFEVLDLGYTTYDNGSSCPSVVFNPWRFAEAIEDYFKEYTRTLLEGANNALETNFRQKFSISFGVNI